jgi:hypothetical protein
MFNIILAYSFVITAFLVVIYFPFLFGLNILQKKSIKFNRLFIYWAISVVITIGIYFSYSWIFDTNLLLKLTNGKSLPEELIRASKIAGFAISFSMVIGVLFSIARRFNVKV